MMQSRKFKIVPGYSGKKQRDEINFLSHRMQRVDYFKAIMKNKMAMLMRLNSDNDEVNESILVTSRQCNPFQVGHWVWQTMMSSPIPQILNMKTEHDLKSCTWPYLYHTTLNLAFIKFAYATIWVHYC